MPQAHIFPNYRVLEMLPTLGRKTVSISSHLRDARTFTHTARLVHTQVRIFVFFHVGLDNGDDEQERLDGHQQPQAERATGVLRQHSQPEHGARLQEGAIRDPWVASEGAVYNACEILDFDGFPARAKSF